jgi:hypothetical protein
LFKEGFSESEVLNLVKQMEKAFTNEQQYEKLNAPIFEEMLVDAKYDSNNNLQEGFLSDEFLGLFNISFGGDLSKT